MQCNYPQCNCPFDMGPDNKCLRGYPRAEEKAAMPTVTGYVSYEVHVQCPHCSKRLNLNEYPYDDDETEYCLIEDELGLALFGKPEEPAKWQGLDIEYQCCGCKKTFILSDLAT